MRFDHLMRVGPTHLLLSISSGRRIDAPSRLGR